MKTALYARKSTESDDRQIQSIGDQIAAMMAVAQRDGVKVDETYVESQSAKSPYTRPEFKRLTDDIEAGRVSRLLVWNMSRLSRNLVDGGLVAHLLQTGRLEWIKTSDRTYRPEDNALLLSIENGVATSFVQDLRKSVVRGMAGKADRGWRPGRVPLGYVNNPLTREIDPDPVRLPLVRKAWEMLLTGGYTPSQIYHVMVEQGLTCRARHPTKRPLTTGTIYAMFRNPFYTGRFMFKGELRPGKHPPVVSSEEFEFAQRVLARRTDRRKRKNDFLFCGLLKCERCGCNIVADRKTKRYVGTGRTVEYVYYHCSNGRGGCSKRGVPEIEIAKEFEKALESIRLPRSFASWVIATCVGIAEQDGLALAAGMVSAAERISASERRLGRLRQLRIDDELTADEYQALRMQEKETIALLRRDKETLASRDERALRAVREKFILASAAGGYGEASSARKRGMLLALGDIHYLNLGIIQISMHAVVDKIAAFGLLRSGSETPKIGDFVPSDSVWYTFARDILTSAREAEKGDPRVDPFDRLNSIKRYKGSAERIADGWGNGCGDVPKPGARFGKAA